MSNGAFSLIFAAWRAPALVSSLARISSTDIRPWPNGWPFRCTVGTAKICLDSTSD